MPELYDQKEAEAFILKKFKEQGDFSFIDEELFAGMISDVMSLDRDYMADCEARDAVYDDDEAYDCIYGKMVQKYPEYQMYMMRLTDDYLDYSEDYLESIGAIEWE